MRRHINIAQLVTIIILIVLSIDLKKYDMVQNEFNSDSLIRISHDDYFKRNINTPHFLFNPGQLNSVYTSSSFTNINVSQNEFPQNEPAVCISRKFPNIVVSCWRDFRTGVDTARRRIGFSRSTDGGLSWSQSALLPVVDSLHPYASDPAICTDTSGNFYISTITLNLQKTDSYICVYKSTNAGVSFNYAVNAAPHPDTITHFDDKEYITCDLVQGSPYKNNLYVVWAGFEGDAFVRSTDGGIIWSARKIIPARGTGLVPACGANGILFVAYVGTDLSSLHWGIYVTRSLNAGDDFGSPVRIDSVPNGGTTLHLPSIATDISAGAGRGNAYVVWSCPYDYNPGSEDEDIFFSRSNDNGLTWSTRKRVNNDSLFNGKKQYFPWITCSDNGNISIVFFDTRNTPNNWVIEAYLARSSDGGMSFTNELMSTQQSPVNMPNADVRFGDYLGIDSWGGKVVPVWTDERAGGFNMEIYTAGIADSIIGVPPVSTNIPERFMLFQNYPNPFNPSTKIEFAISKRSLVNLRIYDVLGKELLTPVNEIKQVGYYSVRIDLSDFSSGVYFYRFEAGDFVITKKMALIK